ncbi:unnamed protein product [Soboliphyme baturini]|uniref:Uncharacterized protein n=1 Tax=Soboliphyme baturini TaxID=241478 RepID=A0A183IL89_9BILA|nr:unnamed protein product [Soboliphyme baturini]
MCLSVSVRHAATNEHLKHEVVSGRVQQTKRGSSDGRDVIAATVVTPAANSTPTTSLCTLTCFGDGTLDLSRGDSRLGDEFQFDSGY